MGKDEYSVQESSAFFQGFVECYFSKNSLSFQIKNIFEDRGKIQEFNAEKFRPMIVTTMNRLLGERKKEGYNYSSLDNLKIAYPSLVDNSREEGSSGIFALYPKTAICTSCRTYINLDKNDSCGCGSKSTLEQFTFIAFCDECGAHYPIHAMSNVGKNCPKCSEPYAMRKMDWRRKDDIGSYSVKCIKCGYVERLFLYPCNHTDRPYGKPVQKRSNLPDNKFRAVPARGSAIIHPFVISTPDIPQIDDLQASGVCNSMGKQLTEAYNEFFSDLVGLDESRLYLPQFWNSLCGFGDFWTNNRVKTIIDDFHYSENTTKDWRNIDRWRFIRTLLIEAKTRITTNEQGLSNSIDIIEKYSINRIRDSIVSTENINFDEQDLQGLFLLTSDNIESKNPSSQMTLKREVPQNTPSDWKELLNRYCIKKIIHISDLNMVQILLGIVEGSTRREVLLFRPIETKDGGIDKPTVFIRRFKTEGVVFQLDSKEIIDWLISNSYIVKSEVDFSDYETTLGVLVQTRDEIRSKVDLLLHTFSHILIQQSSVDTGLGFTKHVRNNISCSFFNSYILHKFGGYGRIRIHV